MTPYSIVEDQSAVRFLPCPKRPEKHGDSFDRVTGHCVKCSQESRDIHAQRKLTGSCVGCGRDLGADKGKNLSRCQKCRELRAAADRERRKKKKKDLYRSEPNKVLDGVDTLQSSVRPAPEQIQNVKKCIEDMDNYTDNPIQENRTLCAHWRLFRKTMPVDAVDWFARLETLPSLKERLSLVNGNQSIGTTNVLETTEEGFREIWDSEDPILDSVGVVVLRKSLPNAEKSAALIQEALSVAYPDAQAELQNYGSGGGVVYEKMDNIMQQFRERRHDPNLRNLQHKTPKNILSLTSEIVADVNTPEAVKTMQCNLLALLCQRLRANFRATKNLATAGKAKTEPDHLVDLESCLRFALLAERRALILSHLDILNGTWVTCLTGIKFWFVYQGLLDERIQSCFAEDGPEWQPERGSFKGILLEPGDTLIMLPGRLIVHSVWTLDDCLMAGGMMWSIKSIGKIMNNLEYIMSNPRVTNEHIPRQFTAIIDTLRCIPA